MRLACRSLIIVALFVTQGLGQENNLTTRNKQLARRYFAEITNQGKLDTVDELLAADVIFRNPPVVLEGRDQFKELVRKLRTGFPDLHFTIEDEIAEGNKVVTRWTMTGTQTGTLLPGSEPTNKKMSVTGIDIFHMKDGQIHQIWVNMDSLGQAQQLGWLESRR